jgi:hypothetical protein
MNRLILLFGLTAAPALADPALNSAVTEAKRSAAMVHHGEDQAQAAQSAGRELARCAQV